MNPFTLLYVIFTAAIVKSMVGDLKKKENYKPVGEISGDEVRAIVRAEFGQNCYIRLTDDTYPLYREVDYISFLAGDKTDLLEWLKNIFDCDNFQSVLYPAAEFALPGCPFGEADADAPPPLKRHALNFFINEHKQLKLVEPQDDRVYVKPADYFVNFASV